ncbi:MAG: peptide ABC transporter substrate-binding protein [Nocardioidaceae bacterium]
MRTVTRMVIGSAVLALAATACGGGGGGGGGSESGANSFSANLAEPESLIPGKTNEDQGGKILNLLFTPLTGVDQKTGEATMLVAKSVESKDRQHWTIKLKDGWKFTNGDPVNAQSFVGAWNATVYNAWDNSYFFTDVLGIQGAQQVAKKKTKSMSGLKTPDDHTIKINLDAPQTNLPLVINYTAFFPMPQSILKSKDWKAYNEKPIGNGKYKMDGKWQHDRSITLAKNEDYAGTQPGKADKITFKIYSDPDTAYNDVVAGNLDVDVDVPPGRLEEAQQTFGDRYVQAPSSSFTYLGFPLFLKRFQDVRVRRAFSMAINREQINQKIYAGTNEVATSIVSPLIKLGHRDDPCGANCQFNPKKAKQLLDQTDFDKSKVVGFWYNTGAGNKPWVQAAANMIHKNLGVKVTLKGQEWAQYLDTTDNHKQTGPYRLGWVMDFASPANYIGPLYTTNGSSNGSGYSNKVVDEMVQNGNEASSPQAAVKYYHKAEDQILDDMPIIPIYFGTNKAVYTDRISNLTYNAQGYENYDQIVVKG